MLESRGRGLFTNYFRIRWFNTRNTLNTPGAINPYFLYEEIRLLKAESKFWLKDYPAAAIELNAATASRIAKGKLPPVAATEADIRKALHYEYAIEIDDAGGAFIPFTFMRRNNLLIGGTPTQYPIPQLQLELIKIPCIPMEEKHSLVRKAPLAKQLPLPMKAGKLQNKQHLFIM
ncbi:hypothetical protein [Paraflavitalea speifideaquila]|uniref:hypothetical protein n=1 Tax=Paraflavitalea speifideaquila TaxID=3076558 RepID=UPI0028ECA161|nr:hypothetical protein [Paraflavitalea speifideiaquila]